jgi:2-haloacid dehalogenase
VVAVNTHARPPLRLTLSLPALTRAANIHVLVAGSTKARALHHALTGIPDPNTYPAAGLRFTEGSLIWWVDREAAAQHTRGTPAAHTSGIKALAFDAYGTLFDVFSVTSLCDELFPGSGHALAQSWRGKQLQYSLLRSMMGRHKDFWGITEDSLVYAANMLKLGLTADKRKRLMDAYLVLTEFPEVKPGLEALKKKGVRLAILSNGEPKMLQAAAQSAGISGSLDAIISVEDVMTFKPAPEVYELVAARLNVAATEAGFVSSNNWDINGAGSAGLQTFWVQRGTAEPQEELAFPANHIVQALTDLPALLAS